MADHPTSNRAVDGPATPPCLVCGHEWERHDPEDGQYDAFAVDGSGICQCGRDLAFHQKWNAYLSRMALGRLRTPDA